MSLLYLLKNQLNWCSNVCLLHDESLEEHFCWCSGYVRNYNTTGETSHYRKTNLTNQTVVCAYAYSFDTTIQNSSEAKLIYFNGGYVIFPSDIWIIYLLSSRLNRKIFNLILLSKNNSEPEKDSNKEIYFKI